jgi:hypothetical protein
MKEGGFFLVFPKSRQRVVVMEAKVKLCGNMGVYSPEIG